MKKALSYIIGFITGVLGVCAGVFVANKTAQPTTTVKGKVKATRGGVANLNITRKEQREIKRSQRKLKKLLK